MPGPGNVQLDQALFSGPYGDPNALPDGPGFYAAFLSQDASLPGVCSAEDGLIYIGISVGSLRDRYHPDHPTSATSTLRRSLGALLLNNLCLQPKHRGVAVNNKNCTHYWFGPCGEVKLSSWMRKNLMFRWSSAFGLDLRSKEKRLILRNAPPLNIQHGQHDTCELKKARAECARIASGLPATPCAG
jgi:hypothetical protein